MKIGNEHNIDEAQADTHTFVSTAHVLAQSSFQPNDTLPLERVHCACQECGVLRHHRDIFSSFPISLGIDELMQCSRLTYNRKLNLIFVSTIFNSYFK